MSRIYFVFMKNVTCIVLSVCTYNPKEYSLFVVSSYCTTAGDPIHGTMSVRKVVPNVITSLVYYLFAQISRQLHKVFLFCLKFINSLPLFFSFCLDLSFSLPFLFSVSSRGTAAVFDIISVSQKDGKISSIMNSI